jgi:6-phosphogluconolactonase
VTGGSTATGLYRSLVGVAFRDLVAWEAVHVWWGDDRYVPRGHPLSNVTAFDEVMLGDGGVPIPGEQLHPFRTSEAIGEGLGAAWCAAALADELRSAGLPVGSPGEPLLGDGWPAFDLLVLGVGGDGHILSVFPGSAALGASALAMAIPAPTHIEPHVERVTLNPRLVAAARRVVVIATGTGKASVIGEIFGPARDPGRWPAQLALREGATWILDAAAAALLADRSPAQRRG